MAISRSLKQEKIWKNTPNSQVSGKLVYGTKRKGKGRERELYPQMVL